MENRRQPETIPLGKLCEMLPLYLLVYLVYIWCVRACVCMPIFVSVCVFWYQVASFLSLVNMLKSLIPRSVSVCNMCAFVLNNLESKIIGRIFSMHKFIHCNKLHPPSINTSGNNSWNNKQCPTNDNESSMT